MGKMIYHPNYDIGFFGLEKLHPFDGRKYSRAYRLIKRKLGTMARQNTLRPSTSIGRQQLLSVHGEEYLDQLNRAEVLADAFEISFLAKVPAILQTWAIVNPMRWAVAGTLLAAEQALLDDFSVNLSGGYHHAKPNNGEGFCLFADVAIAINSLRSTGKITKQDRVVHIDLDAHMGNGVAHSVMDDPTVFLFDMYNEALYPWQDLAAKDRIDCNIPVPTACDEAEYVEALEEKLPPFLDSVHSNESVKLAFYNAGTDIFIEDELGEMNISESGILKRELFVIEELTKRRIPVCMLLSGGYSKRSYQLVSNSVCAIFKTIENHSRH